jgi:hypothetical protein
MKQVYDSQFKDKLSDTRLKDIFHDYTQAPSFEVILSDFKEYNWMEADIALANSTCFDN